MSKCCCKIVKVVLLLVLVFDLLLVMNCRRYTVSSSPQLLNAISKVKPGDVIQLNNTSFKGTFRTERSGAPNAMILLEGNRQTVISNKQGIGFHLRRASYWHLKGFVISDSRKGLAFEKSSNNVIENLIIQDIDEEGVHIYDDSRDNVIKESSIMMTGLKSSTHGEAIVVGRDFRHWFGRVPDQSDRNVIINNRVGPGFSTEAIVLNEGTCCGLLARNYFDGHGMSDRNGYGCWVKIKGDRYRIEYNTGKASVSEGFMVIRAKESSSLLSSDLILEMGGCENIFEQNSCELQSNGYCIKVMDDLNEDCGNVVYSDNAFRDGLALTNIPVTRKHPYRFKFITNQINLPLILAFTLLPSICIVMALTFYFRPHSPNSILFPK